MNKRFWIWPVALIVLSLQSCERKSSLVLSPLSCAEKLTSGIRPLASERDARFQGKVTEVTALCRGDVKAQQGRSVPWVGRRVSKYRAAPLEERCSAAPSLRARPFPVAVSFAGTLGLMASAVWPNVVGSSSR